VTPSGACFCKEEAEIKKRLVELYFDLLGAFQWDHEARSAE